MPILHNTYLLRIKTSTDHNKSVAQTKYLYGMMSRRGVDEKHCALRLGVITHVDSVVVNVALDEGLRCMCGTRSVVGLTSCILQERT
jgi:hypothetical protein